MQRIVRADRRGAALLPRAVVDARAEASRVVERARAQAAAIERRAHDDGHALGLEAARAELAGQALQWAAQHERAIEALTPELREIALRAATHLLGAELAQRPEQIAATVEQLLTRVRRARKVVLRAHPDDAVALREWLGDHVRAAHIELRADETQTRGGCVVQTEIGTLDASIETRIAALRKALDRA